MKKLFIISALFLASIGVQAQTVKKDASGNYYQVKADSSVRVSTAKPTGKTFTDLKGNKFPIMISKNGKLFYIKTSKAGNKYNVYLKG